MLFKSALVTAGATLAMAQNMSLCDKYTTAVFKTNNATNQYLLLKYVVNTALIGNFTPAPTGSMVKVQGILSPNGTYNGTAVNLVPYFDGGLASSNGGNGTGVAMNFLDGGGATPLMALMPANDESSNQYTLVSHLYSFFGALLGCSTYGMAGFPSYGGENSQYSVHAFMDLNPYQVGYFIQEVGLAAESFGVSSTDAMTIGMTLNSVFGYKCAPAVNLTSTEPELQAICIDPSCPLAANATCSAYGSVLEPMVANATLAMGEGVSSSVTLAASGASTGMPGGAATSASAAAKTAVMTTAAGAGTPTPIASSFAYQTAAPVLGAIMAAGAFVLAM